jgi:4-hydroxy-3-methylbut-2-enyl diphosphate reductase
MDIVLAKSAGFCFGVQRAVDSVYYEIEQSGMKIYTYGPIIHNEQVVSDFESKGVKVIEDIEQLKKNTEGTVIIRSHGVEKNIYDILEQRNIRIVDATCPFVKKIHKIVFEESSKGKSIIIIGNDNHPEVEGIKGWVKGKAIVVNELEDIEKMDIHRGSSVCIVSQTTFNHNKFKYLVEIISKKGYDINVVNTICNATHERQAEAKDISSKVDAMIVIGGRHSSNTQKLYDICKKECNNTFFIQTAEDLKEGSDFKKYIQSCESNSLKSIGITAGASTPKNIIEEVVLNVRNEF